MPRAEPTPHSELFARLRERLLVLPNATPNEAAIWNSKALEIVGSIEEQLEATQNALKWIAQFTEDTQRWGAVHTGFIHIQRRAEAALSNPASAPGLASSPDTSGGVAGSVTPAVPGAVPSPASRQDA